MGFCCTSACNSDVSWSFSSPWGLGETGMDSQFLVLSVSKDFPKIALNSHWNCCSYGFLSLWSLQFKWSLFCSAVTRHEAQPFSDLDTHIYITHTSHSHKFLMSMRNFTEKLVRKNGGRAYNHKAWALNETVSVTILKSPTPGEPHWPFTSPSLNFPL